MKKIIFKTMTILFVLSFVAVSCQREPVELNNPNRPSVPLAPQVVGQPAFPIPGNEFVTLTATDLANDAVSFVWTRDDVTLSETTNILTVTGTGYFPDIVRIVAHGQNVSGVGYPSDTVVFQFSPWDVPGIPNPIHGVDNACPVPFVMLTANIPQATDFFWYLDGQPIPSQRGRVLQVGLIFCDVTDTLIGGTGSGIYTVRGSNDIGGVTNYSLMSPPIFVTWTHCGVDPIEGEWNVTGIATTGAAVAFTQDIMAIDMNVFQMPNWGAPTVGIPTFAGTRPNLIIRGRGDGTYFFRNESGIHSTANIEQAIILGNPDGLTGWWFGPSEIDIEFSEDGNHFRFPQTLPDGRTIFPSIVQGGSFGMALRNLVFTRVEEEIVETTLAMEDIVWIPSERNQNLEAGRKLTEEEVARFLGK